jgi:N-formylglutamate amidohydrolase
MNSQLPYSLRQPDNAAQYPVLVTSPHSGARYPDAFLAPSRLNAHDIRQSEDMFVDDLFATATQHGASLLSALYPRAYVDLNRAPYELEQVLFKDQLPAHVDKKSTRASSGLGTVPRLVAENEPIYDGKLTFADAEKRIENIYQPFHKQMAGLLDTMTAEHGFAVLLDAHSMPSVATRHIGTVTPSKRVDFVLGNRHNKACHIALTDWVKTYLENCGYAVTLNTPYAGGYITEHYGKPGRGCHALQIEINRAIYMDETSYQKTADYRALQNNMENMLAALIGDLPQLETRLRPEHHAPSSQRSAAE